MSQSYPLAIQNVGDDTYIVMSKGHHDPHEFMQAVRDEGYSWSLGQPQHFWVKATPTKNPNRTCDYNFVSQGTRGAFPATYAHEAYGSDRYEEQPCTTPP